MLVLVTTHTLGRRVECPSLPACPPSRFVSVKAQAITRAATEVIAKLKHQHSRGQSHNAVTVRLEASVQFRGAAFGVPRAPPTMVETITVQQCVMDSKDALLAEVKSRIAAEFPEVTAMFNASSNMIIFHQAVTESVKVCIDQFKRLCFVNAGQGLGKAAHAQCRGGRLQRRGA